MTGKTLTVLAAGLLIFNFGCAPHNRQKVHRQEQTSRRKIAAVAGLLQAQGHRHQAAQLQECCPAELTGPQIEPMEDVIDRPAETVPHSSKQKYSQVNERARNDAPPVPQPPELPEPKEVPPATPDPLSKSEPEMPQSIKGDQPEAPADTAPGTAVNSDGSP